jgi:lipopolysaccharide biosynthesis regulator YciM
MDNFLILLFILLPVASFSGWFIGQQSKNKRYSNKINNVNPDYLRGINYLLDDKQDKAIDLFVKVIDVDEGTIELHLTLGNLFRKKGEVEKAIKLHQNILAKPDLEPEQRTKVVYELGCDFMSSGLLDRAEGLFAELIDGKTLVQDSELKLLSIYEKEKEWQKAIDVGCRLAKFDTKKFYPQIAHYYCELLDSEMNGFTQAKLDATIQKAYAYDKKSVRARLLECEVYLRRGRCEKAIEVYLQIEKQDKTFLPVAITSIYKCMDKLESKEQRDKLLNNFKKEQTCTSALVELTRYLYSNNAEPEAKEILLKRLHKKPSLRILNEWVKIELVNSTDKNKKSIEIISKMLSSYLASLSQFKCMHCGYKSNVLEWQCPTCQAWGTVKPVFGVSGE